MSLLEVTCRESQLFLAILQPVHDLRVQSNRLSLLMKLIAGDQHVPTISRKTPEALRPAMPTAQLIVSVTLWLSVL
jgi:hypothetical protein